jgi:hypothetical protein
MLPIHENVVNKIDNKKASTHIVYLESNSIKFFNFDINSKTKLEMFSKGYEDAKSIYELLFQEKPLAIEKPLEERPLVITD